MPDNPDYRLYLEKNFQNITDSLLAIHEDITEIKVQTTKTNGRVSDLEKDLLVHPINCSKGKDIDAIKSDLEEYRMIKKYPKIIIVLITVFVVVILYNIFKSDKSVESFNDMRDDLKTEIRNMDGVSKTTRGGWVKYNDNGLTDSIKIREPKK